MAEQLKRSFKTMEEALGQTGPDAKQFAVAAWSMMVGAMMISRVMADDPEADRVLALARKSVLDLAETYG